jgi:hypothetical protein
LGKNFGVIIFYTVGGNQQIGKKHNVPFQCRSAISVLKVEAAFLSNNCYSALETFNYVPKVTPSKYCRTGLVN